MIATLLSSQHFDQAHLRMPAGHAWEGQYGYGQYEHTGQGSSGYPAQLSQMPVHSLDFLDVSARSYPAPQASTSTAVPPTPTSLAASWRHEGHGHARSTSESQVSFDDFDDADEEAPSNTLQRWTSASSADPAAIKRKMKRFRLTHNQTRFLMNEFHREPHPDAAHREYLSQKIPGLSPRQVQVWFQNRRAKSKRVTSEHDSIVKSRTLDRESDQSQSPRPRQVSTQSPSGLSNVQSISVPGHPDIVRQLSTAELFAQTLSEQAAKQASTQDPAPLDQQQRTAAAPVAKKMRKRPETTMLFGRELTVWVDETDTGSDNDDGEGESFDEEEDIVSPALSEPLHQSHYGFPAQPMQPVGFGDLPLHSPVVDLDYYNMSPWGVPQAPSIMSSEAARRASISSSVQQPVNFNAPLQRPSISTQPTWPGIGPTSGTDAPSVIGNAWYQTHKSAYDREEQ